MHIYFKHMGNIHQDSILYQQNKFKNLNNAEYVLWKKRIKLEVKQYGRRRKVSKHLEIKQPSTGKREILKEIETALEWMKMKGQHTGIYWMHLNHC